MNFLEERILRDGVVAPGNILKVDSFLNHQMDIALLRQMGQEFHRRFADRPITKVLTIETSGIAIAYPVAEAFGVPLVYARKNHSVNLEGEVYTAEVTGNHGEIVVAQKFLSPEDRVLIVDDILAGGYTLQGLISLVEAADATVEGICIAIEKAFAEGGKRMRNLGYHLESLAVIASMDAVSGHITFA